MKLTGLLELAEKQKATLGTESAILFPDDFASLINNEEVSIIYLNKEQSGGYHHRAEYKGLIFETDTKDEIRREEDEK